MDPSHSTSVNTLYHQFITIDPKAYRSKVNFYDIHREDIGQLDYSDQCTINIELAEALFHIGSYHRFLAIIDPIIETIIIDNIEWHDGIDIFNELLFKKAAALFNIKEYAACEKVSAELLKIEEDNEVYRILYRNSMLIQKSSLFKILQATGILVFFVAIVVSFLELTVVKIFFSEYTEPIILFRISLYVIGLLLMVGNEAWHYLKAKKKVSSIIKK